MFLFSATFSGRVVSWEFRGLGADVIVEGKVTVENFGSGTLEAEGHINFITRRASGTAMITIGDSTVTMNLVGETTEISTFKGKYRITGGTGLFDEAGGVGSITGEFDLNELTFNGTTDGIIGF